MTALYFIEAHLAELVVGLALAAAALFRIARRLTHPARTTAP